ncbi:MAG: 2-amino-4-hydroxy-6-hydroxymethyldihydropteridine diphosphokinase [Burkholderiales bacterium]|nr:MAG: 2-amino-4-hydroxy-6-hydroxymethyldihydropteridine diphosphokinase [Betaproteobacteria bacterium]TAG84434.1 MAG: 2-amino-4-hydroxy-6-hydroxymethyldihydropteridine diphosphokinase [Burkholderiales bacterium]
MGTPATQRVFVALGANLGNPVEQLTQARRAIGTLAGVGPLRASSLYRSAALGSREPQPDYLNAVVQFESSLNALSLWRALAQIERALGRVRFGVRNAARTIDIDLLLFGEAVLNSPELTLPHPRMHERAFVLAPLVELAPELAIPGKGSASALRGKLSAQSCERVAESGAWS